MVFIQGQLSFFAMGHHYPDRVKGNACNGVLVLTDSELEKYKGVTICRHINLNGMEVIYPGCGQE
jgi:hypothetical protein